MKVGKTGSIVYVKTPWSVISGKIFIPESKETEKFLEYFGLTLKEKYLEVGSEKDKKDLGIIRKYMGNSSNIEVVKTFGSGPYGPRELDRYYKIPGFFVPQDYLERIPDSWDLKKKENRTLDYKRQGNESIEKLVRGREVKQNERDSMRLYLSPEIHEPTPGKIREKALLTEFGKKKRHNPHAKQKVEMGEVTEQNPDVGVVSEVKRYLEMLYTAAVLPKICKDTIRDLTLPTSDLEESHEKKGLLNKRYNKHCIRVLKKFGQDILNMNYTPEIIYSSEKYVKMNSDLRSLINKAKDYFEQQEYPN